ncbi:PRELI domain-containing protein 1, mitochondrial-like isoform X1 [Mustelus asterias]
MVKYFLGLNDLKSSWDQVFAAFWQRYPNPYSKHVLTEDVIHREVTPDKVISRRLLTKTGIVPRWAERLFPTNVAHSAFVLEDSVVDLKHKTLTTFTWNINHSRLMVVREWCVYRIHPENKTWTQIKREAWISSNLYGFSLAIQYTPPIPTWVSAEKGFGEWTIKKWMKFTGLRICRSGAPLCKDRSLVPADAWRFSPMELRCGGPYGCINPYLSHLGFQTDKLH